MTGSRVHQAVPFFSVLAALSFAEDVSAEGADSKGIIKGWFVIK